MRAIVRERERRTGLARVATAADGLRDPAAVVLPALVFGAHPMAGLALHVAGPRRVRRGLEPAGLTQPGDVAGHAAGSGLLLQIHECSPGASVRGGSPLCVL